MNSGYQEQQHKQLPAAIHNDKENQMMMMMMIVIIIIITVLPYVLCVWIVELTLTTNNDGINVSKNTKHTETTLY